MKDLSKDDLNSIIELLEGSGFSELHIQSPTLEVFIGKRDAGSPPRFGRVAEGSLAVDATPSAPAVQNQAAPAPAQGKPAAPAAELAVAAADASLITVTSPMMGTWYRSPSPGAPPFIEVGAEIDAATTIGIIEVMKLMNRIPAGLAGRIEKILVADATLVEFGEPLLVVSPPRS